MRVEGKVQRRARRSPTSSSRSAQRHGDPPRRPRHAGRARARARLDLARIDGVPSISFQVFKQQDANIVETGEAIKAAMPRSCARRCRPASSCAWSTPTATGSSASLDGVQAHADRRRAADGRDRVPVPALAGARTVITGLTLPIAVISAFIAVYAFGFTLNFMTMMALSLCIGLLIDDAIVVRENIVRHVAAWARTTTRRRATAPTRSAWR